MRRKMIRRAVPVLALALIALAPNISQAVTLNGQPIYARNNTGRTLWVAAMYEPPGSCSFVTSGFWQVPPGQCVLLCYNSNRWIYFYARNDQGQTTHGNDFTTTLGSETLPMEQHDSGMGFNPWTITFNP